MNQTEARTPPHPAGTGQGAGAFPAEGLLVVTVALGAVLAPLNSTMIAVALPGIAAEFGAGAAAAGWLVTAYLIAMASLQPVAGRLGDRLGRRTLILGGLTGFGVASLAATMAPSLPLLILFRVAQAVSGAVVLPNGDALLREIVPDARRASRFGLIGSAIGLAAALGPILGGVLVGTAGWRAMFAVNVLLVVPALLLGLRLLPVATAGHPPSTAAVAAPRAATERAAAFDWPGALMLSTVLAGLALLLNRGGPGLSGPLLALGVAGLAVLLALFLRRELRHPSPILQPRFFRRQAFAAATGAVGLSNLAMYSVLLALPLLWARTGRPAAETGLLLGVMAAMMFVASPVGGRLADRLGRRWPTVGGLALLTLGTGVLTLADVNGTAGVVAGLALLGGGLGLANPGLQASALEAVERSSAGSAAGAYSTSRYLGSIVGSAVLAGLASATPDGSGIGLIFPIVVAAALGSALLALGLPPRPARAVA